MRQPPTSGSTSCAFTYTNLPLRSCVRAKKYGLCRRHTTREVPDLGSYEVNAGPPRVESCR